MTGQAWRAASPRSSSSGKGCVRSRDGRGPAETYRLAFTLLLLVAAALSTPKPARAQRWVDVLRQFDPARDVPEQRAALMELAAKVGAGSALGAPTQRTVIGSPGLAAWGTKNMSYCTWWGVNCCGATLTASLPICAHGANSVSGLHLVATGLEGVLPEVFAGLPDLQIIDLSFNRGARVGVVGGGG
jgi:hypothetical protein